MQPLPYARSKQSWLCSFLIGSEQAILFRKFEKEISSTTAQSDLRIRILRKRQILINLELKTTILLCIPFVRP
ncbi:hypothetical protein EUGRSUZ_L02053 [Eucalyptus grandis]|uniref:Uncharacterized protein n=1 Tax=Eucalyptus grandis TaxID=71139 RepID=A0A058ZTW7_EUCGR|nr:hypothetical protein EUGRSUZ_L02053 [Eucalyptus grandis]